MHAPLIFILFGSTGDLALRKVLPSLLASYRDGRLPKNFKVVAFSRRAWTDEEYRQFVIASFIEFKIPDNKLEEFLSHVVYVSGTFRDLSSFEKLAEKISDVERGCGHCQKVFYFAIQPEFYKPVVDGLKGAKLLSEHSTRILVEKPFGHDEASAAELEQVFEQSVKPDQLLHIDHYLAKDGLRNTVSLRKSDPELESKLSNKFVESIHVRMWEHIGIEGRGEFYEHIGALLDTGQNHLLEMLAVVLMDINEKNENKARSDVLESLVLSNEPVFGQYEGYLNEKDVAVGSTVETYVRFEVQCKLPRWQGVKIILETGKAMSEKRSDVKVKFKDGADYIFDMHKTKAIPDAYEVVIEKAIQGKLEYFASFNEVRAAWKLVDPIRAKRDTLPLKMYHRGTNGPEI